ncbi:GNAT family N-acetyltransferase [Sutterella sp.]|uniref:GNAT family N-acetyltransferase n=1 Tax=Sutterella sp. TaxID=1981025 RepID=UPI0026DF2B69|nr:GNAT family N-acetyltransferase [Sutterella sp.]MDO5532474.1 GNAT family N-acetyltransferase [Sutterella sp.]
MFSLRAATPADVDVLTYIEAQCFPEAEKATRESFEARLAVFADSFLILMKDDRPIGLIDGMITNSRTITDDMFEDATLHNPDGHWQSIFGLAVLPSERHQGCASSLIRAFIEKARQEGRDGVILTCKEHLIPFYSTFGFVSTGVSKSVHGGAVWYDMELDFRQERLKN